MLTLPAESSADPASLLSASPRRALQLLAQEGQLQLPAHKLQITAGVSLDMQIAAMARLTLQGRS